MSGAGWAKYSRAPLALRATVALVITLACLAVPALGDGWAYRNLHLDKIYDHDWAMALRACGTLYVWIPVALIIWLVQRERDAKAGARNALLILGSSAIAGLLCEVVKLVIRRERPDVDHGAWVFRPWSEHTFSSAGLATPSSHTMVVFGAATMLARLYPRARWVFFVLAWGCAATRVLAHAHYLSDVTFGAVLGWAVGWGLWIEVTKPDAGRRTPEGGRPEGGRTAPAR